MTGRRFPITIEPAGVTVWAAEGTLVLDAARSAGVMLPAPCGGRGACGKCAIKVVAGTPAPPCDDELASLKLAPKGVRLACRMKVTAPITIKPVVAAPTSSSVGEISADEPLVAGVDLGTTTVSAVVVGKLSGRQLGRATAPNRQGTFGADVLARVAASMSGDAKAIQDAAIESVLDALCAACGSACVCLEDIHRIVIAGNSVMAASLLGEDLAGLSAHPFMAPFDSVRPLPKGWYGGRKASAELETVVLPPISSFVGGDTSAALLAAGLVRSDQTCMMVDMGTNAEVAVVKDGSLAVTSAAAGPALEGVGIGSGGPYGVGSVTQVRIQGSDVQLEVAGSVEPVWLAGSGLVSAIAELRRAGHIDASGALYEEGPLKAHFTTLSEVKAVSLGGAEDAPIHISQTDIRAFQQAKGGVATAVYMLASEMRMKPRKIDRFVVTGALGTSVSLEDLVELGVLPEDLSDALENVEAAALTGAGMLATAAELAEDVRSITSTASHLDLASDERFTETFLKSLSLEPFTLKRGF